MEDDAEALMPKQKVNQTLHLRSAAVEIVGYCRIVGLDIQPGELAPMPITQQTGVSFRKSA